LLGISLRSWSVALVGWLVLAMATAEAARTPGEAVPEDSLTGRLLVATPELNDPNFRHTVIYMVHHDQTGAMGLVVNRVMGSGPLGKLLEGLRVDGDTQSTAEIQIHYGGPVEQGRGFILHSPDYHGKDTVVLSDMVALTSSPDILRDMAAGKGPRESLFALGYAGWAPNQLESEIAAGAWAVIDPDEALLFDDQVDSKWQRAIARRGVDL
jgi:putative transcriptional regulator